MRDPSRRRFLAAAGAAAASVSLAGCSSDSGGDGTQTGTPPETTAGTTTGTTDGTTTEDVSGSGDPVGADQLLHWVPVDAAYEFDVQASVLYDGDLAAIREHEGDLYSGMYDRIDRTLAGGSLSGIVPTENRERVVQVVTAAAVILRTSMEDEALATAFTDAGLSESGTEGDATLFEGQLNGNATTVAVRNGVVVQAFGNNAGSTVSAILGARSGEVARLRTNSPAIGELFGTFGESELAVITERGENTPPGDESLVGASALGYSWVFGADTTDLTIGVTYQEGESGDPSAVAEHFQSQDGFSDYENVQSASENGVVRVTGQIATDQYDLLSAGSPGSSGGTAPQVQFAFDFDASAETMTVTHEGGDTVDASTLTLIVGSGQAGTQFTDEYDQIAAGDSITVDISGNSSGDQVAIIWTDGDGSQVLAQTQIP